MLKLSSKGAVKSSEAVRLLGNQFNLSEEEMDELIPSGLQKKFSNRANWAKTYLKQAGLIHYPKRGYFEITQRGKEILERPLNKIDIKYLEQFPEFLDFWYRRKKGEEGGSSSLRVAPIQNSDSTPDELLRASLTELNDALAAELLSRIRSASPRLFEQIVVQLLKSMGYGGASENPGRHLGRSGDNGVDGVIDQDSLGIDQIYIQAKRYAEGNSVGSSEIREFSGALDMKRTQKGIFFTTSTFSPAAQDTAKAIGKNIVLIDGNHLAQLLIKFSVGCETEETLFLKKIDEDFFETFEG